MRGDEKMDLGINDLAPILGKSRYVQFQKSISAFIQRGLMKDFVNAV